AYAPSGTASADVDAVPEDIRFTLTHRVQAEELAPRGRELARSLGVEKGAVQPIEGAPASLLLEAAKDFDAGLIVVGSEGGAGAAHCGLGGGASAVAHRARGDVLVAHTTGWRPAARVWAPADGGQGWGHEGAPGRAGPVEPCRRGRGARGGPLRLRPD